MNKRLVIITGMSGSGKSTAARTLEDAGYFCVDNLPVDLLPKLIELVDSKNSGINKLALVIDSRQRHLSRDYDHISQIVSSGNRKLETVFLDARDDVLVRRYSETRRQHPLAATSNVLDGIHLEREALAEIRAGADWVIDTSDLNVHQLRDEIKKLFETVHSGLLNIMVMSFGYGKGLPMESDLVLDVRFLPNPYFVEGLKNLTGRDDPVREWVMGNEVTKKFLSRLSDLLLFLLPLYIREGKQYLTISVGCTGGRHRSVVVADYITELLRQNEYTGIEVRHREISAAK